MIEQNIDIKKSKIPFLTGIRSISNLLRNYYNFKGEKSTIENNEDYYETIKIIIETSELFDGIEHKTIIDALKDQKIKINYLSPGNSIIREGMTNCDSVYLLLCGELDILKNGVKINTISGMGVVGEMAFLNPKLKRTATVMTPNGAYVIMLNRKFIDGLDRNYSEVIKNNLQNSITKKLISANQSLAEAKNKDIPTSDNFCEVIKDKVSTVCIGDYYSKRWIN